MKIQNLAVIFIIIVIPIILVLSYYMSLQRDTINMQASYNTKLLESTKEAIEAFEINTVEWNEAYSETADSKRRDVMAAINTFVTSFANNIGIGGASKEDVLTYIPAIAFIGYDGYYIYAPEEVPQTVKDKNGVTVLYTEKLVKSLDNPKITAVGGYSSDDNDKILYIPEDGEDIDGEYKYIKDGTEVSQNYTLDSTKAKKSYEHILKQYIPYSARYVKGNIDIVVNYTLDNYITITGMVNGKYVRKSGYFDWYVGDIGVSDNYVIVFDSIRYRMSDNYVTSSLRSNNEKLSEKIVYKDSSTGLMVCKEHVYVYEAENNTKVYFDSDGTTFQVSTDGTKIKLDSTVETKFKKVYKGGYGLSSSLKEEKISLNNVSRDRFQQVDSSFINYYVETQKFSKWVSDNLGRIKVQDINVEDKNIYSNLDNELLKISIGRILKYKDNNGIYPESTFQLHKTEVIKQCIISGLNQAITSYSSNSANKYELPVISETDWDQLLSNVSIVTFVQGIPIGLKEYNNYAIATSTTNKEYVDPGGIYLNVLSDNTYHLPYCQEIENKPVIGYRNIDYVKRSYTDEAGNLKYYYLHDDSSACYYCLVQRSLYTQNFDNTYAYKQTEAFLRALARERYVSHEFIDYEYSP